MVNEILKTESKIQKSSIRNISIYMEESIRIYQYIYKRDRKGVGSQSLGYQMRTQVCVMAHPSLRGSAPDSA